MPDTPTTPEQWMRSIERRIGSAERHTHSGSGSGSGGGTAGPPGPPGPGVPIGGATGTVLTKKSATDYDTIWSASPASAFTVADGRQVGLTLASSVLTANMHQYADHVIGSTWNNTRANGYYYSHWSDPDHADSPTNARYIGFVLAYDANNLVQRVWNMDMPNGVQPTEYYRTWKPFNNGAPAWSEWIKAGGEPPAIQMVVNGTQSFTGTGYVRPNLVEYKDTLWTSDNLAFYTIQSGAGQSAVRVLQDGMYAISGGFRTDRGEAVLLISARATWVAADQRAIATNPYPVGWGNTTASVTTRLKAGTYVDMQLLLSATGAYNVLADSHSGGQTTDVSSLTIVKL